MANIGKQTEEEVVLPVSEPVTLPDRETTPSQPAEAPAAPVETPSEEPIPVETRL